MLNNKVKKIVCPSLKILKSQALNSAGLLKSVDLQNVEEFGPKSIEWCSNLEKIVNNKATDIGTVIADCTLLKKVVFSAVKTVS